MAALRKINSIQLSFADDKKLNNVKEDSRIKSDSNFNFSQAT